MGLLQQAFPLRITHPAIFGTNVTMLGLTRPRRTYNSIICATYVYRPLSNSKQVTGTSAVVLSWYTAQVYLASLRTSVRPYSSLTPPRPARSAASMAFLSLWGAPPCMALIRPADALKGRLRSPMAGWPKM